MSFRGISCCSGTRLPSFCILMIQLVSPVARRMWTSAHDLHQQLHWYREPEDNLLGMVLSETEVAPCRDDDEDVDASSLETMSFTTVTAAGPEYGLDLPSNLLVSGCLCGKPPPICGGWSSFWVSPDLDRCLMGLFLVSSSCVPSCLTLFDASERLPCPWMCDRIMLLHFSHTPFPCSLVLPPLVVIVIILLPSNQLWDWPPTRRNSLIGDLQKQTDTGQFLYHLLHLKCNKTKNRTRF